MMPTTTCTSKTSRSTKSSAPLLFNVLGGVPLMPSAPKIYRCTLVPGTWYTSTRYCCLRVRYFKAPPFAAIYSYGSFLSAGLELSPIYSSIIYVRKILPLLCTWYSSTSDAWYVALQNSCSMIMAKFFFMKTRKTIRQEIGSP